MELGQRLLPHSPTATGKKSDHEDVSILKDTLCIMAQPVLYTDVVLFYFRSIEI